MLFYSGIRFIFGVLVLLLVVLTGLTVIILTQSLATESMTVLVKAVLNSDTRLLLTNEQGLSQGFPSVSVRLLLCSSPVQKAPQVHAELGLPQGTGPVLQGCLKPMVSLLCLPEHAQCPGS